ncbi:MAG: hypothetical protein AAF416_11335 [Pseudomonadota bacterium]
MACRSYGGIGGTVERFDLGKTRFFPRENLKADRKTMLSDEFFVVSLAETKDLAVIEGSDVRVLQNPRMVLLTYAERFLVRREDPPTTDIWVDAAQPYKGVFFSDHLRQAIKDAGFKKLSFKNTKAPPG